MAVCLPLLLALVAAAPAQQRWSLPEHGVSLWRCDDRMVWTTTGGEVVTGLPQGGRMPAILFADELDDSRQRLAMPPWSFHSLGPWLALDLSTLADDGAFDFRFDRVEPFGQVRFAGRVRQTQDGWQEFTGKLSRRDVAAVDGDKEFLRVERHYLSERLAGSMTVRRRFDARQGRLLEFLWSVDLELTSSPGGRRESRNVCGGQHWILEATLPNRFPQSASGPAFADRVDAAVQRAASAQLAMLSAFTDAVLTDGEGRGNVQGPSLHAVMLLGLARAGYRADDPGLAASLQRLQERELTEPHGLALSMLALGGLHAQRNERPARLRGSGPGPRALPLPARQWLRAQGDRLLAVAGRPRDDAPGLWWSFAPGLDSYWQTSCWLAVLALDEAASCGLEVPAEVWERAAQHFLACQQPRGVPVAYGLRREVAPEDTAVEKTAIPGGWMQDPRQRSEYCTGDATAGAMAALHVCRRRLPSLHRLRRDIDQAIDSGFAWLLRHHTPRHGPAELCVYRQYAAEYTLALACLLEESGVRWLGPRDLYFEQAMVLLREEHGGVFPSTVLGTPAALALLRPSALAGPITPGRDAGR